MLNVTHKPFILSVTYKPFMLSVVNRYAECHYAECRGAILEYKDTPHQIASSYKISIRELIP
jgi:hypothetical protein